MQSVKTSKGTVLPLMNLKGKPYLQVAQRIVWFNEDTERYNIVTEFLSLTEERAVCKATVQIFNKEGQLLRQAQGTKSESKRDFSDFIEKAETGAVGRAITTLGFGTAYALADLDEGDRIIDTPVTNTKLSAVPPPAAESTGAEPSSPSSAPIPSFRKAKTAEQTQPIKKEKWA